MHHRSRSELNRRNDAFLFRRAEDQAFECFQLATCHIGEGDKKAAAALIRKALVALDPYRSAVKSDLQDLLATLEGGV